MNGSSPENAGLQTVAEREARLLAPYAMRSGDSAGRHYAEPLHPYRGPFQRDRDRILHSSAYRRLSGKMQVFTGDMGDYPRTRLTHTQEVASIARTIGRALSLNEDLVEALALFHDIGHPPYGHSGEEALDECLAHCGGFSHNRYALTIAEELEIRYPDHPGLNLTREVLDGQRTRIKAPDAPRPPRLLEVQVVDVADSITYDAHDLDDAVKLGLVSLDELDEIPLVHEIIGRAGARTTAADPRMMRKSIVHALIDHQVSDVLEHGGAALSASGWTSAADARQSSFELQPSRQLALRKAELEAFLYERVYRHADLVRVRRLAQDRLKAMFRAFQKHAELLPARYRERADRVGLDRCIGEYLAGMTDRFCEKQFERICS